MAGRMLPKRLRHVKVQRSLVGLYALPYVLSKFSNLAEMS